VKIVVQVKLLPTAVQARALQTTLRECNAAANEVSRFAFEQNIRSRKALQPAVYADVKSRGLSAQPALHVIRKTADAYTSLAATIRNGNLGGESSKRRTKAESKPIAFRLNAAQPFDDRCLSWQIDAQTVSIWTTAGRMKGVPFACGADQLVLVREHRKGESDLVFRDGMWFLIATCEVPEADLTEPAGWLGVDLGITNIATTSDGDRTSGRELNRHRRRMAALRAKLQAKKTKSARRRLKRIRRRESRFSADTNHCTSKTIMTSAQRTNRGIGLEDLAGIRDRARLRTSHQVTLHSWAFQQLRAFITYKALRAGVVVQVVDPRSTSRECFECGHIDKRNRPRQAVFRCVACDHTANADHNASRVVGRRAENAWNAGRQSSAPTAA
jgi:putative transposase